MTASYIAFSYLFIILEMCSITRWRWEKMAKGNDVFSMKSYVIRSFRFKEGKIRKIFTDLHIHININTYVATYWSARLLPGDRNVSFDSHATLLATVDTVSSATGINSVNTGTHCRVPRVTWKKAVRPMYEDVNAPRRLALPSALARKIHPRTRISDSPSRDHVIGDHQVPSSPSLRRCRRKRPQRKSPRLTLTLANSTTLWNASAKG